MSKMKDMQKAIVIDAATELFFENGIDAVKISDIAKKLGIGEATIYRYFGKKQYIVMESAVNIWKKVADTYLSNFIGNTAFEKITCFYNQFIVVYRKHCNFYRFIAELDSYIMNNQMEKKALISYELGFLEMYNKFVDLIKEGILDKSIKEDINYQDFYNMSTHAILSLCKKFSLGRVLSIDVQNDSEMEISMMIDVLLEYIKK